VSPEDAALFARDFGVDNVEVVDNGVDVTYFTPGNEPRERAQILFLGSLDWRPNQDAVEQLLQLAPTVRREEPEARFVIVGRQPPEWLRRRVASAPGVELHADVNDVRPFLRRSTCLAVPLRIGGGSRLKILEALASGLPVVSTRLGAEGLHLEPGQHLDVCESPGEMTPLLIQSIRSPQRANSLAQAGREVVLQRYDWDVLAERLEQIWLDCAG
jgi:glycosyltransferase involved in cell wall biosynthesis